MNPIILNGLDIVSSPKKGRIENIYTIHYGLCIFVNSH